MEGQMWAQLDDGAFSEGFLSVKREMRAGWRYDHPTHFSPSSSSLLPLFLPHPCRIVCSLRDLAFFCAENTNRTKKREENIRPADGEANIWTIGIEFVLSDEMRDSSKRYIGSIVFLRPGPFLDHAVDDGWEVSACGAIHANFGRLWLLKAPYETNKLE